MEEGKVVAWGGLINSWGKQRSEKQGRREIYTQLNAKSQRITRKGKKTFLNEQCKGLVENNRIGKIRYLFKKTGDIKGIFHTRIVTEKEKVLRT